MDRTFAAHYIETNFEPSDRLAVVVSNPRTGSVTQRISAAEHIASPEFQAWLRRRNNEGCDIRLSTNALKPDARARTKDDIGAIRHIHLEFNHHGEMAVDRLIGSHELAMPNYIVDTHRDKRHLVWRVEGFSKDDAEQLQHDLAQEWDADPAATDCARALPVPGFDNYESGFPYRVRTEPRDSSLSATVSQPDDFTEFPSVGNHLTADGELTHSEVDRQYAKQALTRGEPMASIIEAIAEQRRDEHPNPENYATHTVRKAAAALAKEQHRGYEIVDFDR